MRPIAALLFCTCCVLFGVHTAAAQSNCQENDCPAPPAGEIQMLPSAATAVCSGTELDACLDMGDPADESYHALEGWGANELASPIVAPSGDVSKRFQIVNGDNSFVLRVPTANVGYQLVAEVEDGGCDDSFSLYVNDHGPVYTYSHNPAIPGVVSHTVSIAPDHVPTRDVRLTFRNLAGDWCGQAAV
jgi:hypothetical protein